MTTRRVTGAPRRRAAGPAFSRRTRNGRRISGSRLRLASIALARRRRKPKISPNPRERREVIYYRVKKADHPVCMTLYCENTATPQHTHTHPPRGHDGTNCYDVREGERARERSEEALCGTGERNGAKKVAGEWRVLAPFPVRVGLTERMRTGPSRASKSAAPHGHPAGSRVPP